MRHHFPAGSRIHQEPRRRRSGPTFFQVFRLPIIRYEMKSATTVDQLPLLDPEASPGFTFRSNSHAGYLSSTNCSVRPSRRYSTVRLSVSPPAAIWTFNERQSSSTQTTWPLKGPPMNLIFTALIV